MQMTFSLSELFWTTSSDPFRVYGTDFFSDFLLQARNFRKGGAECVCTFYCIEYFGQELYSNFSETIYLSAESKGIVVKCIYAFTFCQIVLRGFHMT